MKIQKKHCYLCGHIEFYLLEDWYKTFKGTRRVDLDVFTDLTLQEEQLKNIGEKLYYSPCDLDDLIKFQRIKEEIKKSKEIIALKFRKYEKQTRNRKNKSSKTSKKSSEESKRP